jgi:lysophospholipase L1-like esterase
LLLILAVGVVVAVALVIRDRRHAQQATALPRSAVSMVGDSLNLGTEAPLREALRQWRFRTDDVVGRDTATGIERLRAEEPSLAPYVVISLGTNDPSSSVDSFRADVAAVLSIAGPRRCVIWATIHRDGHAYDAFNDVLRAAAARNRNVRVVEWSAMIDKQPKWLAFDGIHGNPDGYAARAAAVVAAMRSCNAAGIGQ